MKKTRIIETLVVLLAMGARAAATAPLHWSPRDDGPPGAARVAAWDRARNALALGTLRGVEVIGHEGVRQFIPTRSAVRDLAFGRDGRLFIATEGHLWLRLPGREVRDETPSGLRGGTIARLALRHGTIALATGSGVLVQAPGKSWERVGAAAAATAVAIGGRPDATETWWIAEGSIRSVRGGGRLQRSPDVPRATFVDLALDVRGASALLLAERELWFRRQSDQPWQRVSLDLPAGARALRWFDAAGSYWIATARGLLRSPLLAGPWRRAAPPVGFSAVHHVEQAGAVVLAAADRSFYEGRERSASGGTGGFSCDPPIAAVYRQALDYLNLHPQRFERLHTGVERRGWLPTVSVRLERDVARRTQRDWDEVLSSGDVHALFDRDRDRAHESSASVTLAWDLGDIAFHPDAIDVSREVRELVELRDDILDEIAQHYFERRRALRSQSESGIEPAERERLRTRADELAARIDAWTGGWFGRAVASTSPATGEVSTCSGNEYETWAP